MSIYKKFINSATINAQSSDSIYKQQQQQHQQQAVGRVQEEAAASAAATEGMMIRRQKSRVHPVQLSPIASVVGSNLSSTPINSSQQHRVHFKQLVDNSNDEHANKINKQQQQHHHQHYQNKHQHDLNNDYGQFKQQQQQHNNHHHRNHYNHIHQQHQQQQQHYQSQHHQFQMSSTPEQQPAYQALRFQQAQPVVSSSAASSSCFSLNSNANNNNNISVSETRHLRSMSCTRVPWDAAHQQEMTSSPLGSFKFSPYNTNDPVLLEWLRSMRFQPELECLTALQARTLAVDENAAGALSVRNSQVAIQEMRLESDFILNLTDRLIDMLPVSFNTIDKFAVDFSDLWTRLVNQTVAKTATSQTTNTYCSSRSSSNNNQNNNLTIVNCTPRKSLVSARTLKPLDKLAIQIRNICMELANSINNYQENFNSSEHIDNSDLEAMLRKIKELFGKFVEITVRAECANIVRALDYDFTKASTVVASTTIGSGAGAGSGASSKLHSGDSAASLRPVRPYESSSSKLPLKWALIALWQLTKDDAYICRTLTEKWQTGCGNSELNDPNSQQHQSSSSSRRVAKRLDYSTNNEQDQKTAAAAASDGQILPEFEKIYQICPNSREQLQQEREAFLNRRNNNNLENQSNSTGALSSALKSKQLIIRQVSTIELLINIIISQPNRHERLDMLNFVQNSRLVDVQELDQSMSAAFYTSNQYKVAALRILNHLCINEQAIKTILKCFSTPPPKQGYPRPENRIIKSIFGCYQTAQEHIYQNETIFNINRTPSRQCRKRARQVQDVDCDEYSDYGSRQTNSVPTTTDSIGGGGGGGGGGVGGNIDNGEDESDDAVVREAIRLVVQLTTPFHSSNQGHDYYTLIGRFSIESLVKYLTNIIKSTASREMVLLSLSALANISFITTEPMKEFGTNRIVLEMFRAFKNRSKDMELRDQAVTILANTADKNFLDVVNNGGLTFLLSCLEICPTRMSNYKLLHERLKSESLDPRYASIDTDSDTYSLSSRKYNIDNKPRGRKPIQLSDELIEDLDRDCDCACDNKQQTIGMPIMCLSRLTPAEQVAMERIHQKTAVAFARLAADPSTTKMVLNYGGVKQMIDLCKLSHRRNHSDTVLIACLAALRKIHKVIGSETFRHYNALDLIELEPNQAFEIYRLDASEV